MCFSLFRVFLQHFGLAVPFCYPFRRQFGQIPHLDPNDPRIQAAVEEVGRTSKKDEDKSDDEKKDS